MKPNVSDANESPVCRGLIRYHVTTSAALQVAEVSAKKTRASPKFHTSMENSKRLFDIIWRRSAPLTVGTTMQFEEVESVGITFQFM